MHPPGVPFGGGGARTRRPDERLRVVMYSAMTYEIATFQREINNISHASAALDLIFVPARLDHSTANLAQGARAISLYVSDYADSQLLETLSKLGVELITLRYPGVSSVDVDRAAQLGIIVARAPSHSPTSIAEYTVTLMLALIRKVHLANNRVRHGNLSLNGLVGFELADKIVGIIGTGRVGQTVAKILQGFGCTILAHDVEESPEVTKYGGTYVKLERIFALCDILTLHAPLVPGTHHMIGRGTLPRCKQGVHIINTSRGGLIDVAAILEALQTGQVAGLAMDVYEGERSIFFQDRGESVHDWSFEVLKSMPNVLITGHQSALTTNALASIAQSTLKTLMQFRNCETIVNAISVSQFRSPAKQSRSPRVSIRTSRSLSSVKTASTANSSGSNVPLDGPVPKFSTRDRTSTNIPNASNVATSAASPAMGPNTTITTDFNPVSAKPNGAIPHNVPAVVTAIAPADVGSSVPSNNATLAKPSTNPSDSVNTPKTGVLAPEGKARS